MPANRIGNALASSMESFTRFEYDIDPASTVSSTVLKLPVVGMPKLWFYVYADSGLAGTTFTPEFAIETNNTIQPNWLPLTAPQAVIIGQPVYLNITAPVPLIGLTITTPAGAINTRITAIIGASQ